jgi:hypothetical protein
MGYMLRMAVALPATSTERRRLPLCRLTLNTHLPWVMGLITTRTSQSALPLTGDPP